MSCFSHMGYSLNGWLIMQRKFRTLFVCLILILIQGYKLKSHKVMVAIKNGFTWQGLACMRFCSKASLVPPITTWTPMEGWYFSSLVASAAAWLASSRVGHMISTRNGGRFWSRSIGGDFTTTSIDGSWIGTLQKHSFTSKRKVQVRQHWHCPYYHSWLTVNAIKRTVGIQLSRMLFLL